MTKLQSLNWGVFEIGVNRDLIIYKDAQGDYWLGGNRHVLFPLLFKTKAEAIKELQRFKKTEQPWSKRGTFKVARVNFKSYE